MRTPEETLVLFKQVLEQRRQYVRDKVREAQEALIDNMPSRGRPKAEFESERMIRGGMLSELSTIECVLKMIEQGDTDPLTYWTRPQGIDSTAILSRRRRPYKAFYKAFTPNREDG